jgi:hypothetical protein
LGLFDFELLYASQIEKKPANFHMSFIFIHSFGGSMAKNTQALACLPIKNTANCSSEKSRCCHRNVAIPLCDGGLHFAQIIKMH